MADLIETFVNIDLERVSIAFWGPTASGKTTLWWAFWRQLHLLSQKLQNVEFTLVGKDGRLIPDPTSLKPTERPKHDLVLFKRLQKGRGFNETINTHAHWIGVLDSPGEHAIEALKENPDPNGAFVRKIIMTSQCLVVILNKGNLEAGYFYESLGKLRRLLTDHKKSIAFCLTKTDGFGDDLEDLDPTLLLTKHFGAEIGDKILLLIGQNGFGGDGHKVFLCATSALGVIREADDVIKPNFDPTTGTVLDINSWRPQKVEQPFFWLFEKMELERLNKSYSSGLFYNIYNKDYKNARRLAYIKYNELLRKISWGDLMPETPETPSSD